MHFASYPLQLRTNFFDCAISTDTLFQMEYKKELISGMIRGLKVHGQLLITDFVRREGSESYSKWLAAFGPTPAHVWSAEDYMRCLRATNLELQTIKDITEMYRRMVLEHMARLAVKAELSMYARAFPHAVTALLNLWEARVAALEKGAVKVMQFVASKRREVRLLSDW